MENTRKNPKRKVSETQEHGPDDETADLLLRACSPLTVQDIEDWQGWVELESEPVRAKPLLQSESMCHTSAYGVSKRSVGLLQHYTQRSGREKRQSTRTIHHGSRFSSCGVVSKSTKSFRQILVPGLNAEKWAGSQSSG